MVDSSKDATDYGAIADCEDESWDALQFEIDYDDIEVDVVADSLKIGRILEASGVGTVREDSIVAEALCDDADSVAVGDLR